VPLAVLVAPVMLDESVTEAPATMVVEERLVVMLGLSFVTVRLMITQWVSAAFVPVTFNV